MADRSADAGIVPAPRQTLEGLEVAVETASRTRSALKRHWSSGAEKPLCTFGWSYREDLSADANYMDLASLLARNSRYDPSHPPSPTHTQTHT